MRKCQIAENENPECHESIETNVCWRSKKMSGRLCSLMHGIQKNSEFGPRVCKVEKKTSQVHSTSNSRPPTSYQHHDLHSLYAASPHPEPEPPLQPLEPPQCPPHPQTSTVSITHSSILAPSDQPSQTRALTLSTLPRPTLRSTALESAVSQTTTTPSTTSLVSLQMVRGGKRDTYDPSHVVRKRRLGFLARVRSRTGRQILRRRKTKGRRLLSH